MLSLGVIPYPHFNPDIVRFGPIALRWYGLAYLTGFVFAYLLLIRMAKKGWLRIRPELVGDLVTWLAFGVFIGGRTGWWLFYHRPALLLAPGEPWYEPLAIWHGGMSFHGGLLGVFIAMYWWGKRNHASLANLADCGALVTPIGLFFGRIANFINGELYGRVTHVRWAMVFPSDPTHLPRHPSQIYEAILEGIVLLGIVWFIFLKFRPRDGGVALAFVIFYSLIRFGVEFTREPDEQLEYIYRATGLSMGQYLSIAIALAALVLWIVFARRRRPEPTAVDGDAASRPQPKGAGSRRV